MYLFFVSQIIYTLPLNSKNCFDKCSLSKLSKPVLNPVDLELFKLILERYKSLKIEIRFKTGQYTDPKWKDCPNRVASVYVAAIIQYFES